MLVGVKGRQHVRLSEACRHTDFIFSRKDEGLTVWLASAETISAPSNMAVQNKI